MRDHATQPASESCCVPASWDPCPCCTMMMGRTSSERTSKTWSWRSVAAHRRPAQGGRERMVREDSGDTKTCLRFLTETTRKKQKKKKKKKTKSKTWSRWRKMWRNSLARAQRWNSEGDGNCGEREVGVPFTFSSSIKGVTAVAQTGNIILSFSVPFLMSLEVNLSGLQ